VAPKNERTGSDQWEKTVTDGVREEEASWVRESVEVIDEGPTFLPPGRHERGRGGIQKQTR